MRSLHLMAVFVTLATIASPLSTPASASQTLASNGIATAKSIPTNPGTQQQLAEGPIVLLDETGVLEAGDQLLESDGSLYDMYAFEGEANQTVTVSVTSEEFDTYLVVFDENGTEIARNDDTDTDTVNSEVTLTLPYDGSYAVVVNGFDSTSEGDYSLVVFAAPMH